MSARATSACSIRLLTGVLRYTDAARGPCYSLQAARVAAVYHTACALSPPEPPLVMMPSRGPTGCW